MSKPKTEIEVAIFAKVTNPEGLREAISKEHHEQLEGPRTDGGRFRCRKTTDNKGISFVLTLKVPVKEGDGVSGVGGNIEEDVEISEVFFNTFKNVSTKLLKKTRYVFESKDAKIVDLEDQDLPPLPVMRYEVDVFETQDGGVSEWVKIDIELDELKEFLEKAGKDINDFKLTFKVSHLPFKPVGGFLSVMATPEQKKFLGELWDKQYNLPVK